MNKLKVKINSITFKYGILLSITGTLIFLYSKIIFKFVENVNLGSRFKGSNFYESDLFNWIGTCQILIGLLYILIYYKAKFYLIDKATIRNYWFTLPLIVMILITPLLDKYYPTDKYGSSILTKFITFYGVISAFLFFVGIYYIIMNFIKSIYTFYVIKKKWK